MANKKTIWQHWIFLLSRKALSAGHPITTEYGTPGAPDPETGGIVSRIVASLVPGEMTDNCACSVYQFGRWELFIDNY